jgi:hypothetical protein
VTITPQPSAERTLEGEPGWQCRAGRAPTPFTPAELVAVWRTMQWHDSGSTIARLIATVFEADYRWSDAITEAMIASSQAEGTK